MSLERSLALSVKVRNALAIVTAIMLSVGCTRLTSAISFRVSEYRENVITAGSQVVRNAGFDPLVGLIEDIWYGLLNPPQIGGAPVEPATFDQAPASSTAETEMVSGEANIAAWGAAKSASRVPDKLQSPLNPLKNEGVWKPTKILSDGKPAIWVAKVRPDKDHSSILATVVWFDTALLAFQQIPGTELPEGNFDHGPGTVSKDVLPFYVAGFANAYKMNQSQGGFVYQGKVVKRLKKGKATLLTYPNGDLKIVKWGFENVPAGYLVARQNLDLMVENSVSMVKSESDKWGSAWHGTGSGKNFVWRSGLGVRADGTLVYVQSDALSAKSLSQLLVKAGAVKAMALDMNSGFAVGAFYGPYGKGGKAINNKLVPSDIFYKPSSRDFVAVFTKSPN
jgi:hypothetical protein